MQNFSGSGCTAMAKTVLVWFVCSPVLLVCLSLTSVSSKYVIYVKHYHTRLQFSATLYFRSFCVMSCCHALSFVDIFRERSSFKSCILVKQFYVNFQAVYSIWELTILESSLKEFKLSNKKKLGWFLNRQHNQLSSLFTSPLTVFA